MKQIILIKSLSIYKILINLCRIFLGLLIIKFNFNISKGIYIIKEFSENNVLIVFILNYIRGASFTLTFILAITLILFSIFEIIFVLALINRKKFGAIGLFATSILWIPVEILFISKFLVASKFIVIAIDLLLLYLLYNILSHPGKYFKTKEKYKKNKNKKYK